MARKKEREAELARMLKKEKAKDDTKKTSAGENKKEKKEKQEEQIHSDSGVSSQHTPSVPVFISKEDYWKLGTEEDSPYSQKLKIDFYSDLQYFEEKYTLKPSEELVARYYDSDGNCQYFVTYEDKKRSYYLYNSSGRKVETAECASFDNKAFNKRF